MEPAPEHPKPRLSRELLIPAGDAVLQGALDLPPADLGLVVFAHGSGSGRNSPRNLYVARRLWQAGLGTLLFDLLTAHEQALDRRGAALRFDIGLLARRLVAVVDWLHGEESMPGSRLGLFGASTGAAAALLAAARRPRRVSAVVSRGGRPDLAGAELAQVLAPTLLIVGGLDTEVIELNRLAAGQLRCEHDLRIVPGATHLFEEPGTLGEVAGLAAAWFLAHAGATSGVRSGA